jgi:hypothetical protein
LLSTPVCDRTDENGLVTDPEPTPLKAGSTLRFRIENAARGLESSAWSLVGAKKSGDLYFAGRGFMGDFKLSLHQSGITRMAWTEVAAEQRLGPDADRAVSRWAVAETLGAGWEMVMRLTIPDSALSPVLPPLPGTSRPTVTLAAPGPGYVVVVRVMVGRPGAGSLHLEGELEEVGRMLLGDGTQVLVTAWKHPTSEQTEAQLRSIRAQALKEGAGERPVPRCFGWGTDDGSGIPVVFDAGDPREAADRPAQVPYFDGPSNLEVYELDAVDPGADA